MFGVPSHLRNMPLVQNLLNRDQLDDPAGLLVKRRTLGLGVGSEAKRHKEAARTLLVCHHRLELVNVRPSRMIVLLHPHGEPVARKRFAGDRLAMDSAAGK